MKKAILLFVVILGCIIPTYSQVNRNSKANTVFPNRSFYQNKENNNFGNHKFSDGLSRSLKDAEWDSEVIPTIGTPQSKITNNTAPAYNMPCFKPEGSFAMRVYKPDTTKVYSILLKKF